ncbi:phage portal protein, partial [Pseudomonas aeruginosa]|nr:phage portal protein [Pseudomonas aeruginosa]
ITRCLIGEADADEFFAEFAVEGLLRADSTARAAWYNTALQNGWMSRNEVRRLENLPPIEGGDVFTVQSALVPLEQLGATAGGVSPAATAYMLRLVAANESGDKAAMRQAIDLAVEAL